MSEFLKILLSLSVSGTLLLLLTLGMKQLYKNKFSRHWQYYIWLIIVLRFLLPFTPDTTIVGKLFEKLNTTIITSEPPINPDVSVAITTDSSESGQAQENKDIIIPRTAIANSPIPIYDCLFFLWVTPALALFARKITLYQGFIQFVKAGNTKVSDINTLNRLSGCAEKLNIHTKIELYHNASVTSPMMTDFFRPSIVLPAGELEENTLSYIFLHELIHYKQKDMFYKWLIQIVVCVHWFNPFIYLLEKEVNQSCELSCDEKVISMLDKEARREYGDMLISFLKSNNLRKNSFASVTLTEGAAQLKERLGAIMNFKKKTTFITGISLVTAFLLSVGGFAIGAYAAQPTSRENKTELSELSEQIAEPETNDEINQSMSIIHESADILQYENGSPYIHAILTNKTDKTIVETTYCMLAYNENGLPVKLHWNFLDSSAESSYENLVRSKRNILSNQTEDYRGGWSLYDGEQTELMPKRENGETSQIAYVLCCLKQVVFEDGTVWNNPDYDEWHKSYAGKETSVDELQSYYPCQYGFESN